MIAKELIYNLRTILEQAGSSLIDKTDQHLMYMLDEARATLASRRMTKGQNVNLMIQSLELTPEVVDKAEFGTVGDTRVLKVTIPQPVCYHNKEAIITVGSTDGQDSMSRIEYGQIRTALFRKYTSKTPKWAWHENAIYIINSDIDSRSKVRIRGIFSEPYRVEIAMGRYKYLTPFAWEYPLGLKDADAVYKLAFGSDLGWGDVATQAVAERAREAQKQSNAQVQQESGATV